MSKISKAIAVAGWLLFTNTSFGLEVSGKVVELKTYAFLVTAMPQGCEEFYYTNYIRFPDKNSGERNFALVKAAALNDFEIKVEYIIEDESHTCTANDVTVLIK